MLRSPPCTTVMFGSLLMRGFELGSKAYTSSGAIADWRVCSTIKTFHGFRSTRSTTRCSTRSMGCGVWPSSTSSCSTQSLRRHLRMKTLSAESAGRRAELAQDKSLRVRGNDILCSAIQCGAMDYTERPEKESSVAWGSWEA